MVVAAPSSLPPPSSSQAPTPLSTPVPVSTSLGPPPRRTRVAGVAGGDDIARQHPWPAALGFPPRGVWRHRPPHTNAPASSLRPPPPRRSIHVSGASASCPGDISSDESGDDDVSEVKKLKTLMM
uniref:Uncharacterized protein n=1 Tax=Setaria viridis TaxID=4556 RepID=A0A4U6T4B4_SETVI|nr:hypothetical protein SEVIR_9G432100v2 [Setaria viridis]